MGLLDGKHDKHYDDHGHRVVPYELICLIHGMLPHLVEWLYRKPWPD